jgi:hypothetical protein
MPRRHSAASPLGASTGGALLGGDGHGGDVSIDSVSTVDQLVEPTRQVYGDASLDWQRDHQPVETTLIDIRGRSHDELHVRIDQGHNPCRGRHRYGDPARRS